MKLVTAPRKIALAMNPAAHFLRSCHDIGVDSTEQLPAGAACPLLQFDRVPDFLQHCDDASHVARLSVESKPIPERGAVVETVVLPVRSNEHIRVDEVELHGVTPNSLAIRSRVAGLRTPSMRNASVYRVLPSSVSAITALAKGLLSRARAVR